MNKTSATSVFKLGDQISNKERQIIEKIVFSKLSRDKHGTVPASQCIICSCRHNCIYGETISNKSDRTKVK